MIGLASNDKIFATGVFLQAVECTINGIQQWHWVAVGFESETFVDGQAIEVTDYAYSFERLFSNKKEEI